MSTVHFEVWFEIDIFETTESIPKYLNGGSLIVWKHDCVINHD